MLNLTMKHICTGLVEVEGLDAKVKHLHFWLARQQYNGRRLPALGHFEWFRVGRLHSVHCEVTEICM